MSLGEHDQAHFHETKRQRLYLFVPVSTFLIVNLLPWFGFSYLFVVFQWATFQRPLTLGGDLIFPVTLASAIVTVILATYLFFVRSKLRLIRSIVQGFGLAFAATALFEMVYQFLGFYFYPTIITGALWPSNYVLNGSWLFLAFTSAGQWKLSARFKIMAVAFAVSWAVWVAIGFPQLFQEQALALIANSITKVLSFAMMLSAVDFRAKT